MGCRLLQFKPPESASKFFKYALSTIQSPTFSQVQVIYNEIDFAAAQMTCDHANPYKIVQVTQDEKVSEYSFHQERFRIFREMREVRQFQLVLCLDLWEKSAEPLRRRLEEIATAEKERGGLFDNFFPEPVVTLSPRTYLETVVSGWPIKYF